MKLSSFDYHLPGKLIAQHPLQDRDKAGLLVLDRHSADIAHRQFKDLPLYLSKGDLLLLNDTRVLSCRLLGRRKTGGRVEALLISHLGGLVFQAMLKPARLKLSEKISFDGTGVNATIIARDKLAFEAGSVEEIYKAGVMPLPPYIKREPQESDRQDYQTVYAKNDGAIASPTAGLHFTEGLLSAIRGSGVDIGYLTLHVGPGTFRPVKTEDPSKHKMEGESFFIPAKTRAMIDEARRGNRRIIPVGTTTLRALEAYAAGISEGRTDLFIYPGFNFRLADCLVTNFHLPKTTLFMLVCAFAGTELAHRAYREAIERKYRFYSYGDAMLIL